MPDTPITRHRTVVKLDRDPEGQPAQMQAGGQHYTSFLQETDENLMGRTFPKIQFETARWEQLGKPEELTITVEAGDQLNEGEE